MINLSLGHPSQKGNGCRVSQRQMFASDADSGHSEPFFPVPAPIYTPIAKPRCCILSRDAETFTDVLPFDSLSRPCRLPKQAPRFAESEA